MRAMDGSDMQFSLVRGSLRERCPPAPSRVGVVRSVEGFCRKPRSDPRTVLAGFGTAYLSAPRQVYAEATSNGKRRKRFPLRAKTALAIAGAIGGVPGSPIPVGGSLLGTMCTLHSGI